MVFDRLPRPATAGLVYKDDVESTQQAQADDPYSGWSESWATLKPFQKEFSNYETYFDLSLGQSMYREEVGDILQRLNGYVIQLEQGRTFNSSFKKVKLDFH